MEKQFINSYSKSQKNVQQHLIIDYKIDCKKILPYNKVYNTIAYNTDSQLFQFRTYNNISKNYQDLKVIGKYNKIDKDFIKLLPLNTYYRIKQKIYGDIFYLTKHDNKIFIINEFGKNLNEKNIELRNSLNIKFLIDKFGRNGSVIELINNNKNYYLTNIFNYDKVFDQKELIDIGNYFDLKTAKILNNNIFKYDSSLMNVYYNNSEFDDSDYILNKEYLIMFEFKNNKYLFCKI